MKKEYSSNWGCVKIILLVIGGIMIFGWFNETFPYLTLIIICGIILLGITNTKIF
jgi:uncharacterized membrane protein HdeD (DUF308 family)